MAVSTESSQHVLLVPFMAQGHFIPFLELADLLIRRTSVTATIVTTPLNVTKLRSSIPPDSPIHFAGLPFSSSDHGLPPDSESTDTVPAPYMSTFIFATETLQAPFERLVSGILEEDGRRRPLLIISDFLVGWTVETARKLKVPHAAFSTCGAFGTAVVLGLWLRFPHLDTDSDTFNLPGFPDSVQLHRSQLPQSIRGITPTDPPAVFARRQLSLTLQSDAMLCNSVEGIEKAGAAILSSFVPMPVWFVGPLLPRGFRRGEKDQVFDGDQLMEWLDGRPPRSVVYVSFGSQGSIWPSQMKDLAMALEGSGHPFVWAIRPPKGDGGLPESEWLPEGFEERVAASGQGMLVKTWAPQLEILSHRSTAAFLSHCGWNSVVESLSKGVPIMGWPVGAEQAFNSMVVEELGVGVEVVRGLDDVAEGEDGGVRGRLESALAMVVGDGEKGLEMREKAGKIGRVFKSCAMDGGSQERSISELISNFFGSKHI